MQRLGAVVFSAFACGLAALHANAAPVAAIDPLATVPGLGTVVIQDATLANGSTTGSMAVGGTLTLAGPYRVDAPTLTIGGRVDFAASDPKAILQVTGDVRVADLAGAFIKGGNRLVPRDDAETTPRIEAGGTIAQGTAGLDLAALSDASAKLSRCKHHLNVLNLTGEQFNALGALTFTIPPSRLTPLLINVDTASSDGILKWSSPDFAGVTSEQARYLVMNFPNTTDLHHVAGGVVRGTILAPHARFVDANPSPIEGVLAVKSLEGGAGELRPHPFDAAFECDPLAAPISEPMQLAALAAKPMIWIGAGLALVGFTILAALVATPRKERRSPMTRESRSHSQSDMGRNLRR